MHQQMPQTKKLLDMLHDAIEAESRVIVENGLSFPLPAQARDALMQLEWLFHIYTSGCQAVCDTQTFDIDKFGACPDWHDESRASRLAVHGETPGSKYEGRHSHHSTGTVLG